MIWNEIICFGDSLTFGARDEFGRSYPAELSSILKQRTGQRWICHNYGINEETSSDMLRRCAAVFNGHPKIKIVTLLSGTNDTKIPIPVEIYRDNLLQITDIAQIYGKTVVLGLLPPIKLNPFYLKNREYVQKYSTEIRQVAEVQNLTVCDLSMLGDYLCDGVHFDHAGYKEMAKLWAETILNL